MEIRPIFFKEIVGSISLKNDDSFLYEKYLHSREGKSRRRFFLPKASLISIFQNFYCARKRLSCLTPFYAKAAPKFNPNPGRRREDSWRLPPDAASVSAFRALPISDGRFAPNAISLPRPRTFETADKRR